MNRRNLLSSTAIVASVGVLAACAATGATATVQQVLNQIQYLLPLVKVLAAGIAIAVPQSAAIVATVTPYLDNAGAAFQTLSATMTAVAALPVVRQVEGYVKSAVDAVANVVNTAAPGSKLAQFAPQVQEAQAVLALITAFATGAQGMPTAARVQAVSLPLLHR